MELPQKIELTRYEKLMKVLAEFNFDRSAHWSIYPCMIWFGSTVGGYGTLTANGKSAKAHRIACEHAYGPIPPKYEVDHLCRNTACFCPAHLEAVPKQINWARGSGPIKIRQYLDAKKSRSHCCRGHEWPRFKGIAKDGKSFCRECRNHERRSGPRKKLALCAHGHTLAPDNFYLNSNGAIQCSTCRDLGRLYYRESKSAITRLIGRGFPLCDDWAALARKIMTEPPIPERLRYAT